MQLQCIKSKKKSLLDIRLIQIKKKVAFARSDLTIKNEPKHTMQLLQKSTYSQAQNTDANPTKHLENSTSEYLHMSFLLWEYKQSCSKKEYRELLQEFGWDKGKTEQRRALKLAEHYQKFAYRPQALIQIPMTTLLKLCSDKYKLIIEELEVTEQEITFSYVTSLIKDREAKLKKDKGLQLPEKPSIWRRNCRGERYAQYPPIYEKDQQTGILTQKLMDEYGLIPHQILREAIEGLHQKYEKKQQEGDAAQHMDDVVEDERRNSCSDNYSQTAPQVNQSQTVEEKWQELNQSLKADIEKIEEISQETGELIFEACQDWEAAVPQDKKWSAIANIAGHDETSLKYLSDYGYANHPQWRHSWGAILTNYHNFEQELEWVGIILRTDALIAMGYKIPTIVKVNDGSFGGRQGEIIELHGENDKPILVEFEDFSGYFHWSELEIVTPETFDSYTSVKDIHEEEYLEEPIESEIELEPMLFDKAVDTLIQGNWEDIRNIFNEHPEIKEQAWNALSPQQKRRVVDITPETVKVLNQAKKEGVIAEYKEIAVGVYRIKLLGAILWEQRAFHEIEIRHYLRGWREATAKRVK